MLTSNRLSTPPSWYRDLKASIFPTAYVLLRGTKLNRTNGTNVLLRGTKLKRTYGTNKNLYIYLFFLAIFGPTYYGSSVVARAVGVETRMYAPHNRAHASWVAYALCWSCTQPPDNGRQGTIFSTVDHDVSRCMNICAEASYDGSIVFGGGGGCLSPYGVLAERQLKDERVTCALHCWA